MNTLTKEKSSGKGLRTFAGILFLVYVATLIFRDILYTIVLNYTISHGDTILDICANMIYYIAPQVIAIFLFIKKKSLAVTIALGAMAVAELYWFVINLSYGFTFEDLWDTLWSIYYLTAPLLPLCTFIFSMVNLINERNRLVKLWFIPLILVIFDLTFRFVETFRSIVIYNDSFSILDLIGIFLTISYNLPFLFYCISLAKGGTDATISTNQQPKAPVHTPYRMPAQTPQPQAPVYISNISPVTGQSYPTDSTEELRKYKTMLDEGLISPEDYERKKNEILGL